MMHDRRWIEKASTVTSLLGGLTVLLVLGCAEERPPIPAIPDRPAATNRPPGPQETAPSSQNANVAGTWQIVCEQGTVECHNFTISFAESGEILGYGTEGGSEPAKGMGAIRDGKLHFVVMGVGAVEFDGALDADGQSARGQLKGQSTDGKPASATAERGNPLCDGPNAHRMRSCR